MGRAGPSGSTLSDLQALGQCLSPSWSAAPLVICSWSVQQARFTSGSLPAWSGLSRPPWQMSLMLAPAWVEMLQGLTQSALSLAGCSVTRAIKSVWQAPLLQSQLLHSPKWPHRVHLPGLPLPDHVTLPNCCSHLPVWWCFQGDIFLELSVWGGQSPSLPSPLPSPLWKVLSSSLWRGPQKTPSVAFSHCSLLLPRHFLGLKRLGIAFVSPKSCLLFTFTWHGWSTPPQHSESLECIFITSKDNKGSVEPENSSLRTIVCLFWFLRPSINLLFFFKASKCPMRLMDALGKQGWISCTQKGRRKSTLMIFNAYHVGSSYHQHAKGLVP